MRLFRTVNPSSLAPSSSLSQPFPPSRPPIPLPLPHDCPLPLLPHPHSTPPYCTPAAQQKSGSPPHHHHHTPTSQLPPCQGSATMPTPPWSLLHNQSPRDACHPIHPARFSHGVGEEVLDLPWRCTPWCLGCVSAVSFVGGWANWGRAGGGFLCRGSGWGGSRAPCQCWCVCMGDGRYGGERERGQTVSNTLKSKQQ